MKNTFGMELTYEGESAVFTMRFDRRFDHSLGSTHGGVIATILDNAGWFTAALHYDNWIATTDLHVQLLRNVSGKSLTAYGELVKAGKQMAFTKMKVLDEDSQLIAVASGSFCVTSQRLI